MKKYLTNVYRSLFALNILVIFLAAILFIAGYFALKHNISGPAHDVILTHMAERVGKTYTAEIHSKLAESLIDSSELNKSCASLILSGGKVLVEFGLVFIIIAFGNLLILVKAARKIGKAEQVAAPNP